MLNPQYNKRYFLEKFKAIPESKWCVDNFTNFNGQRCALGHCGAGTHNATDESFALRCLLPCSVAAINDGEVARFHQPTPKQRIIAALELLPD
jgi:hypothetical protein